MKPIPFFSIKIAIKPHTATRAEDIGKPISLTDFSSGGHAPVALYELPNGDLRAETRTFGASFSPKKDRFIEGPEA